MADDDMKLPAGKTCGDCRHVAHCLAVYGIKAENTTCDFAPSRFEDRAGPMTDRKKKDFERCKQECQRDVIFVLQVRTWQRVGDIEGIGFDDGYMFVENWPEGWDDQSRWPEQCDDVPEWIRTFVHLNDGSVSHSEAFFKAAANETIDSGFPLYFEEWRTESVWLDRTEAEAYAKAKEYRWCNGWRVFALSAGGELARLLKDES